MGRAVKAIVGDRQALALPIRLVAVARDLNTLEARLGRLDGLLREVGIPAAAERALRCRRCGRRVVSKAHGRLPRRAISRFHPPGTFDKAKVVVTARKTRCNKVCTATVPALVDGTKTASPLRSPDRQTHHHVVQTPHSHGLKVHGHPQLRQATECSCGRVFE